MALSPAARAALEQFRQQQSASPNSRAEERESDGDSSLATAVAPSPSPMGAPMAPSPSSLDPLSRLANIPGAPPVSGTSTPSNGGSSFAARLEALNQQQAARPATDSMYEGGLFRPEQPKTFKEAGISYRVLEGLILKTIKQEGPQNEAMLSEFLKLSANVFQEIVKSLHKRELLDTPQPLFYDLTTKGREMVSIMEREDGYVGPAPVSFQAYCEMCRSQAKRERRVTIEDVKRVFSQQSMRPELLNTLKEGFNSEGRIMLFYGPPGNGKSLITDALHGLLQEPVLLPYAFEFNSKVVSYYDPAYHKVREDLMAREENEAGDSFATSGKPDRRWLVSNPPLVTVGTEFKTSHFEIAFDGQYAAPPHVKANNGIFIFDDLGRQTEDHNMILNQFIYPLEQQESIVKFTGGSSMRAPFLERLFLSTNLNHEELLDDAFKRRLQYQILVDRPTEDLFKDIFQRIAAKHGVDRAIAVEMSETLVRWYKEDDRIIRAVDPRNLFRMMDATLDEGERLAENMDMNLFRRIYENYPAAFKKDAKFFVGAMDADPSMASNI
jgi:predicted ATPase with chaperone activity